LIDRRPFAACHCCHPPPASCFLPKRDICLLKDEKFAVDLFIAEAYDVYRWIRGIWEQTMASPITSTVSQVTANVQVSTPAPPTDTYSNQPSKPAQSETSSSAQVSKKDTVQLSQEALNLSKDLLQKNKALASGVEVPNEKVAEMQKDNKPKEYSASKSFPPFIGNTGELKQLKQTSPALYREILKMIVPPPLDLTYYEQQMLKGPSTDSTSR